MRYGYCVHGFGWVSEMRGSDAMQESLFTVVKLDDYVPADHPLRAVQVLVNEALGRWS
jgi:hypothetical protein